MAKEGKTLTAEEAKEKLSKAKEKLIEAKEELASYCKNKGLKKNEDHSAHEEEKIAAGWKKRNAAVQEAEQKVDKATEAYKAAKKGGKKEGGAGIKAKYSYPKDITTADDKKKYRQEVRAKAKKLGITVDEYLADPEKYNAKLKEVKKGKSEKPEKEEKPSKKKSKEKEEEKPKKKKKKPAESAEAEASSED